MEKSYETVMVNSYTDGILGPNIEMLGPVKDGGYIMANTAPGCWGPMITPTLKGGHEVTKPVLVEGAEVGDAIAIEIKSVSITSMVASSGNDKPVEGRFNGDPFVADVCPNCGESRPDFVIEGIGSSAIKCAKCKAEIAPFVFNNGYTMAFDNKYNVGITLEKEGAEKVALNAKEYMKIPDNSKQIPIALYAAHDLPGMVARLRPFIGQLGTTPSLDFPDSHNAGDFGQFLIDAPHEYAKTLEELNNRTDGHMDINKVREGAVIICPVKIPGAGVYVGDVHAMQGNGEIAGHTCDVSSTVVLRVHVIKNLNIDGPILIPLEEDLPYLARPITKKEYGIAEELASFYGVDKLEKTAPVSFIGTGANLNDAIENGISRAAKTLDLSKEEVKNRLTTTGSLEIGRAPGTITATFLAPVEVLKNINIYSYIKEQYNLL